MQRSGSLQRISYAAIPTRLGPIWAAWTRHGVCRISFRARTAAGFTAGLRRSFPEARIVHGSRRGAPGALARELSDYAAGRSRSFSVPIDLNGLTAFHRRVLMATARIPYGDVVSYGTIAAAVGQPGASRAVGNALGGNPVPILIPCHRVIASGGRIGGFTGGLRAKRRLLSVEGISL